MSINFKQMKTYFLHLLFHFYIAFLISSFIECLGVLLHWGFCNPFQKDVCISGGFFQQFNIHDLYVTLGLIFFIFPLTYLVKWWMELKLENSNAKF